MDSTEHDHEPVSNNGLPEPNSVITATAPPAPSRLTTLKRYFIYVAIGAVILSAAITIISILLGEFTDITWRALGTTASISIHALVALAFVSANSRVQKQGDRFIENLLFTIVVTSFIDSILGIWGVIDGETAFKFYVSFFWAIVAGVIIKRLLVFRNYSGGLRLLATITISLTVALYIMILPGIFFDTDMLADVYFRLLGAAAVLEGTLCVLLAIFQRLAVAKIH